MFCTARKTQGATQRADPGIDDQERGDKNSRTDASDGFLETRGRLEPTDGRPLGRPGRKRDVNPVSKPERHCPTTGSERV